MNGGNRRLARLDFELQLSIAAFRRAERRLNGDATRYLRPPQYGGSVSREQAVVWAAESALDAALRRYCTAQDFFAMRRAA